MIAYRELLPPYYSHWAAYSELMPSNGNKAALNEQFVFSEGRGSDTGAMQADAWQRLTDLNKFDIIRCSIIIHKSRNVLQ